MRILKDSICPNGKRITTFELTYPRFVHAELMTHRLFSRNSASSRAIPVSKMMRSIRRDPVGPVWWGKNQSGMQAKEELAGWRLWLAKNVWFAARWGALAVVWILMKLGLHKQIANRVTEPWMFITVIVTATEFDNWFKLRCHPDAQPEIKWVADRMKYLYDRHRPSYLKTGRWHLPLIDEEDWAAALDHVSQDNVEEFLCKVSVGRCARVSYLTHDGKRDLMEDVRLHDRLLKSGHWSPFEHVARAMPRRERLGNFVGWLQYRKLFADEHPTDIESHHASPVRGND